MHIYLSRYKYVFIWSCNLDLGGRLISVISISISHALKHLRSHSHARNFSKTHITPRALISTHVFECTHIPPSQNTHTHPNTQTSTHACGHTHERRYTYAHTRTRSHTSTHAHVSARKHTHTRAHTHMRAYTRMRAHEYTRPHTRIPVRHATQTYFSRVCGAQVNAHESWHSLQNCLPLFQLRPPLHVVLLTSLTSCSCGLFSFEAS